jgi:hypothetical protein
MTQAIILATLILSAPVQPEPVPLSYWLAECSSWPMVRGELADTGIQVQSIRTAPGRVSAYLRHPRTRQRAAFIAARIGSREAGWSVWSIRGPAAIRRLMASSESCRVVATYTEARSWPVAARQWLQARSTCYGSATWRGRAYASWPCRWATERAGQGVVAQIDGIGPGVLQGGSGAEAAGVTQ